MQYRCQQFATSDGKLAILFREETIEKDGIGKMNTVGSKLGGYILLLIIQATFVVIYGIFVRYEDRLLPTYRNATENGEPKVEHASKYPRE